MEEWKEDLKKVFESFQRTYVEDARDEAKMEDEDVDSAGDEFKQKTYEEFEAFIFDYICEFFEQNEGC